ncbi:MAG: hypothetical protein LCH93_16140, partial [Proteobacteria bacterium]|nr:hypothetical protein [Pseudomonadota bacterium]
MGSDATMSAATATPVAPAAQGAALQDRPLRERVLAGHFFADHHAATAGDLSTFLHGGLDTLGALRAWFGDGLTGLLASGTLRGAIDRDIADI